MNCLSSMKDNVQLLDLPDELILIIMNKVKPKVLLLSSIVTIGNNRLEQLALDKCHSIDLTFDYFQSPYQTLIKRFYSHVMPHIINNIQSLALTIRHIPDIIAFAEKNYNGTLPNLTHLKIMIGKLYHQTGTPYTLDTLGMKHYRIFRRGKPLLPIIPQFVRLDGYIGSRILSTIRCSSLMRSIVSFELDDDCILPFVSNSSGLFFPQAIQLTHIRITLNEFDDCVRLLSQLGSQLCSFTISIVYVYVHNADITSQIASILCPYLKQLTMKIYQNIINYEECIVPLLQRFSNVEYLTLLLAINGTTSRLNHFVNGFDLEKDIVSYMPHLSQFRFHIRSIFENATHIEVDRIRQSFLKYQQESVDCAVDYFNNNYGQCQIYSLPFIGNRLDFISNRFPLFNMNNTFSMVTVLLLFDDVKPFENLFFARIARDLPHLKTLELFNELEQQEKTTVTTNNVKFTHLSTLILFDIHMDYAEQFLYRSHLPCLIELAIHKDILLTIIAQDQQQARDNCSKVHETKGKQNDDKYEKTEQNIDSKQKKFDKEQDSTIQKSEITTPPKGYHDTAQKSDAKVLATSWPDLIGKTRHDTEEFIKARDYSNIKVLKKGTSSTTEHDESRVILFVDDNDIIIEERDNIENELFSFVILAFK